MNAEFEEEIIDETDESICETATLSPSLSTSTTRPKRKIKSDRPTTDLCTTLTEFIVSRGKADNAVPSNKKKLTVFFDDIAETMSKFLDVDQAEIKREIFNVVNKREIELLQQMQIRAQCVLHQNQQVLNPTFQPQCSSVLYPTEPYSEQSQTYC
jgi:hypothetical protein